MSGEKPFSWAKTLPYYWLQFLGWCVVTNGMKPCHLSLWSCCMPVLLVLLVCAAEQVMSCIHLLSCRVSSGIYWDIPTPSGLNKPKPAVLRCCRLPSSIPLKIPHYLHDQIGIGCNFLELIKHMHQWIGCKKRIGLDITFLMGKKWKSKKFPCKELQQMLIVLCKPCQHHPVHSKLLIANMGVVCYISEFCLN